MHFKATDFGVMPLDHWPVTVCAWRGCCIEVFARAEHSVAACLRALEQAGIALGKDAHHPAPAARLKALAACIAQHDFGGHGKVALTRIAAWERIYETRAILAHGTLKAVPDGIVIQLIAFDGKAEKRLPQQQVGQVDMLRLLGQIEAAQIALHHQLGQIKALAAKARPAPLRPGL